jgi:hypothetical protein
LDVRRRVEKDLRHSLVNFTGEDFLASPKSLQSFRNYKLFPFLSENVLEFMRA